MYIWRSRFGTLNINFCRTMLASSAALAVCACVSVCPSVTFVDCVKTNKHTFKMFSLSGSQAFLVFRYHTAWQRSYGNTPNGDVKCRWGRQKSRSSWYSWLSIDDVLDLSTTSATIHRAVYHTYDYASMKLCLSQPAACATTTKRGELNSVRSSKSEAELALDVLYYW